MSEHKKMDCSEDKKEDGSKEYAYSAFELYLYHTTKREEIRIDILLCTILPLFFVFF